jgi:hypothetical protein
MPKAPTHPEPTLQTTALRYAAGDLSRTEAEAFELRLAEDQEARDALSEAVRLSAAALGQEPPAPDSTFRASIRERLTSWCSMCLRRRAYKGHPLMWVGVGGFAVALSAVVGLAFAEHTRGGVPTVASPGSEITLPQPVPLVLPVVSVSHNGELEPSPTAVTADLPACGTESPQTTVAELWAELSTTDHAEKTHDEEIRWRQRMRDTASLGLNRSGSSAENRD